MNTDKEFQISDVNLQLLTSRPAMQWKKYSCGLIPVRNLPDTKPPARGVVSYGRNDGSDRPLTISGGRRPSNSI